MNFGDCNEFSFSNEDFVFQTKIGNKSKFDKELESSWQVKMDNGYFRYKLGDLKTRHLPGKYNFVAQLNIKRAVERRKPDFITDVIMPFDPNCFNFTKISNNEILFSIVSQHQMQEISTLNIKLKTNVLAINVSPLEYCNSLLVPGIEECYPQVINFDGLKLAVETMLISANPALRIGFNSLGGYASVNHFHFHLYYLKSILFIEHAKVEHLMGNCHVLKCFPANGFVFEILKNEDIGLIVGSVLKLINFLLERKISHNIFITRGSSFKHDDVGTSDIYDAVRIYIWARKSVFGSKYDKRFNPALCELGGHLVIKEASYYDTVTENDAAAVLQDACQETFDKILEDVKLLYS
ncbi:GDP-D-glucose phosphorylase 1-like isoform X2 [Uloborus diversus]|uniref:GDP-D-glucose phosphorylase 1-like isoform X2 n=1 Tax=Uloborus diversus TaxID=327109 RepID=UPI00240A3528|nr:GDP-D-glucose phosphorylase 1-like isoform X2 [Uloborus diversus]